MRQAAARCHLGATRRPTLAATSRPTRFFTSSSSWVSRTSRRMLSQANTPTNISTSHKETAESFILWLQNIYPVQRHAFDIRSWFVGDYARKICHMFPPEAQIADMKRASKEGGVYVFFHTPEGQSVVQHAQEMITHVQLHSRKMFPFAAHRVRAHLVQGKPFIEDIIERLPSSRLEVQFKGPDLSLDKLFELFRPYGRIKDMHIPKSQPKDDVRHAILQMEKIESAIAARNCIHNKKVNGTQLVMQYDNFKTISYLKKMFSKHPRIMFPVVGLLITATTYSVIDPLRIYNIYWRKLKREYHPQQVRGSVQGQVHRQEDSQRLLKLFSREPSQVILISSSKGSGASSLLESTMSGHKGTLLIKCDAHNADAFIDQLCRAIAFAPSFYYVNQIGTYMDAIIPSSKNFFSQGISTQLTSVLRCLTQALEKSADENAGEYPVVIFDGFARMLRMMEDKEKAQLILTEVLAWASDISCHHKYAHVLFVSDDPFAQFTFRRYVNLAGGIIDIVWFADVEKSAAKDFIRSRMSESGVTLSQEEMEKVVSALGGRLADLAFFCNKVKSGESMQDVLEQMIEEAISIIRNKGFEQQTGTHLDKEKQPTVPWLKSQFWVTIKKIAANKFVDYDELLFTTFNGDERALQSLVQADLLRVEMDKNTNKIGSVIAFSPLYLAAFKQIVSDPKISAGIGIIVKKFEIEQETAKMNKKIDEMVKLRSLVYSSYLRDTESAAVTQRRQLLESKLNEYNTKLGRLEKELAELSQIQANLHL